MPHEARRRELYEKLHRWRRWGVLNEEATIQGLVMPVLQAAGYDTLDPEQVYPQPREAIHALRRQFPEHMHCVEQWAVEFVKHLEGDERPAWWVDDEQACEGDAGEALAVTLPATECDAEPISVVYRKGIQLRGYSPCQIIIRGQSYAVSDWVQALMTLVRVLDEAGCLSEPPCPPERSYGAYDRQPHKWINPRVFQSRQYGQLYVNKHGSAPQLAERLFWVAAHSRCADITPDTVLICLRKRD